MSAMYCTEREPRGGWPRVTLFRLDNTCRKGRTGPSVRTALRQAPAEPGYWPTKKRSGVWFTRRYSFFLRTQPNQARPQPPMLPLCTAEFRGCCSNAKKEAHSWLDPPRFLSRAPPSSLVVRRVVTTGCVGGSPTGPVSTPPPRRIERELASPDSGVATHLEHPRRRRDRCKRATVATSETAAAPPVP